jgi:polyisoprenyl-phosphate glycosyltransferase
MKKISLVVSVFNEEGNITKLLKEIGNAQIQDYEYEIIFVNDCSTDQSETIIKKACKFDSSIKLITFTRNYGHEIAMSAGMDIATGDAVIFMDADLQHPPHMTRDMIEKWEQGKKIVLTNRVDNKDNSIFYKIASLLFYKLLGFLSDSVIKSNTPDFRLVDKYYIGILKRFNENSRLFRGLLQLIASEKDIETIDFIAPKRFSGESKYNLVGLFNLAMDSILAFSVKPLRIALILSLVIFLVSIIYSFFLIVYWLVYGVEIAGFMTQVMLIILLGSGNLFVLSVIGEYIGRIHIESKQRPLYTTKELINFD